MNTATAVLGFFGWMGSGMCAWWVLFGLIEPSRGMLGLALFGGSAGYWCLMRWAIDDKEKA